MDNKNIWVALVVAIACLFGGFVAGGKYSQQAGNNSSSYVCNGGTVAGGSTTIPQGSVSANAAPGTFNLPASQSGQKFGAAAETFSLGGYVVGGQSTTTIQNTTGTAAGFSRGAVTTTLDLSATGTCQIVRSVTGTVTYITYNGANPVGTTATCQ